ncbi:MAG: GapR family DNA-binding domain-containing protein, partial [Pseudomonadota bacterium]
EKKEVAEQIKEVYAEAKGNGFDAKTLRKIVSLRKKPTEEREEEEALLDLYLSALGMVR